VREKGRNFQKAAHAVFDPENGRNERLRVCLAGLRSRKELALLDGSDFRDLVHQYAHLIRAVVDHHAEFRRCSGGGQAKQGADVYERNHDPPEVSDSR
jgi:hypothetical protein